MGCRKYHNANNNPNLHSANFNNRMWSIKNLALAFNNNFTWTDSAVLCKEYTKCLLYDICFAFKNILWAIWSTLDDETGEPTLVGYLNYWSCYNDIN